MTVKVCTRCKQGLPLTSFYVRKDIKSGLDPRCKQCKKETRPSRAGSEQSAIYWQKYYSENSDKLNQRYWTNPKAREYQLNRYKQNPEKFCKQHEDYRKNNLDKFAAKEAKRRSRKLNATPPWLTETHFKEMANFYWLAKDLETVTGQSYHVDHIVPLQGKTVCGLHVPWNLQVLPSDVNLSKSNKLEEQ
jgi:hypothetical protein